MQRNCSSTKVSQLQFSFVIDEQVLGLQVSVEDFPLVAVGQTPEKLEHEDLQENINIQSAVCCDL